MMTDAELERIERDARAVAAAGAEEARTGRECQALADLHLAVPDADERTRIQVAVNDRHRAALGRYCDLHGENLREADVLALVAEVRRLRAAEARAAALLEPGTYVGAMLRAVAAPPLVQDLEQAVVGLVREERAAKAAKEPPAPDPLARSLRAIDAGE